MSMFNVSNTDEEVRTDLMVEAEKILTKGYIVEDEGKRLVATGIISDKDLLWLVKTAEYHEKLTSFSFLVAAISSEVDLQQVTLELSRLAFNITHTAIGLSFYIKNQPRNTPIMEPYVSGHARKYAEKLVRLLEDYNDWVDYLTGATALVYWTTVDPRNYTWAMFLSDYTSLINKVLDYIANLMRTLRRVSPKVYAVTQAPPHLVNLATMWEKSLNIVDRYGLTGDDYKRSHAIVAVYGLVIEIVGRASAIISDTEVYYLDHVDTAANVITNLAEQYGCRSRGRNIYRQMELYCPNEALVNYVKYVLPLASGMANRLIYSFRYWYKVLDYQEIYSEDPIETEINACKWFIENVLKKEVG